MVPFSLGCGSAVLAAIATLAPSRAARSAIASPMPRLAPEMNNVLPLRDVMGELHLVQEIAVTRSSPLPKGEVDAKRRVRGYGLTIDRTPSPQPSPHGRGGAPVSSSNTPVYPSACNTLPRL